MSESTTADPDVDAQPSTLTVRRFRDPSVPVNIHDMAALRGEAMEVFEARLLILETARRRAIRLTHPEDWVLFKSPDERITGYLQDAGCDRVRDIIGVEVFDVTTPQRITSSDGQSFMYVITGNGRSRMTLQVVENMEGGRSSTDDFCKGKAGAELELTVRKAARANLDGNITRELTGLKSVPLEELQAGWEGTNKNWEHCRKGRGFGSQSERLGATREGVPDVPPPTCPHCAPVNGQPVALKYRQAKGDRKAFYGCPNYEKHPQQKVIIDAAEWVAKHQKAKTAAGAATANSQTSREPGEEG